jgi:uncharacterized protein YciI
VQFLVLARDAQDSYEQRLALRDRHVAQARDLQQAGNLVYAAALLNDQARMNGSMMVFEFETRAGLDRQLERDPYMLGRVWQDIEVFQCKVGPMFMPVPGP